jgi:hypothetical protein
MSSRRFLALLSFVAAFALGAPRAHADPTFTLPDLNFAALGHGRTGPASNLLPQSCPTAFNSSTFEMAVGNAAGDSIQVNLGSGFHPVPVGFHITVVSTGSGHATGTGFDFGPAHLTLSSGGNSVFATTSDLVLQKSLVGYDGLAIFTITGGTGNIAPYFLGESLGLDLDIFNVHATSIFGTPVKCGDVKGDLAPVVPEPATVTLLVVGLAGIVVRRRAR